MPKRASSMAAIMPAGPAPMITTVPDVFSIVFSFQVEGWDACDAFCGLVLSPAVVFPRRDLQSRAFQG